MIAEPVNDESCLGSISAFVQELIDNQDETLAQIAGEHATTESLIEWIRSLPQRDDKGVPSDGPKEYACSPPQRVRIPADDPNCVERSALYLGVAELIDPEPVRQLKTIDTPAGAHTYPLEDGKPVVLNPLTTRNCLDCATVLLTDGPLAITPDQALQWVTQLASVGAGDMRNAGPRMQHAQDVITRFTTSGVPPVDQQEVDSVAWFLSLAEQAAHRYGPRALAIVRSTALALAELIDDALARLGRNLSFEIGGTRFSPAPWLSSIGRVAARVGVDVGAIALRSQLAKLGVTDEMVDVLEDELNREGYSLGSISRPRHAALARRIGIGDDDNA